MSRTKSIIFSVFFIFISMMYILFSQSAGQSVSNAVNICLRVIIPSTYGFMIISSLIIRTGVHRIIIRPFRIISEYVFKIPCELFSVFIISCFAGYPVGIKMIYELFDNGEIDKDTAEYMSCFCFAGGPAFIMGTVSPLFSDKRMGMVMFTSITAANIISAFIAGIRRKICIGRNENPLICKKLSAKMITSSVESSAKSMFIICAMITGFAVFSSLAECTGIFEYTAVLISKVTPFAYNEAYNIILTFTEISHVTDFSGNNCNIIPVMTSLLSYGGLCVTVQAVSMTDGRLNLKKFFLFRFFSAVISGIICKLIISRMDIYVSAVSLEPYYLHNSEYSAVPSVMLIIMTILLIKEMRTSNPIESRL